MAGRKAPKPTTSEEWQAYREKRAAGSHEDRVHKAVLVWVRRTMPHALVYHTPNGGRRSRMEAIRFKALGVMPGVPDLTILLPGGQAIFLEIKPEKTGALSPEQKLFRNALATLGGYHWACVRSIDDARDAFSEWGIVSKEKAA